MTSLPTHHVRHAGTRWRLSFGLVLVLVLGSTGCDRPVYVGDRSLNGLLSGDEIRSPFCHVWAISNAATGEVRFVAHGLATGFVPVTSEASFPSVEELALAIKANRFGPIPIVRNGWDGDRRGETLYSARDLATNELTALKKAGVRVAKPRE